MKIASIISMILLGCFTKTFGWGFWGHKKINRMACFTLPPGMFGFYKIHIDYITEHAVDADKRRYAIPEEAPRHYIDADHYGEHPFDSLPENWKDAVAKYTEDSLNIYGICPWYINKMYYNLRNAFKENDVAKILYYSANIGHYIGDSHVPLHCTENYNGQLTDQHGIHGFWESRLPELFGDEYDKCAGKAIYIENVQQYCWKIIHESYAALDSVLRFERELNNSFASDRKYAFELRGNQLVRTYSSEYSEAYHNKLQGQVERRMHDAILAVGSIWYTAWVDGGMPILQMNEVVIQDSLNVYQQITDTIVGRKNNKRECD